MDAAKKRELRNAYKEQPIMGGIYRVQCEGNQRAWIRSARNLEGQRNKYEFAMSIHSCPEPWMRAEWEQYGEASFSFTVLETLTKKETQTEQEYLEDLGVLLNMWTEKQP